MYASYRFVGWSNGSLFSLFVSSRLSECLNHAVIFFAKKAKIFFLGTEPSSEPLTEPSPINYPLGFNC